MSASSAPALVRLVCAAGVAGIAVDAPAQSLSRFAVDTAAAIDRSVDNAGNAASTLTLDAVVSTDLGSGFEAIVRPFVQRQSTGAWNRQIWVATVRYERAGPVGLRIDSGLIPSPVGLANLMLRPQLNPTISLPSSLFAALPITPAGPRTTLLGPVYASGVNATVSGTRWDARVAAIDTSPLRTRRVFSATNPPRFLNAVVGAGVTPIIGFRAGGSVTHGGWQRAGEHTGATADRDATIVTLEADYSRRHTRVLAEWTRSRLDTENGAFAASGWFVQVQQTITPRWFAAARAEYIASPLVIPGLEPVDLDLRGIETVVGYRVTPEVTVRAGYRGRRPFGRPEWADQVQVSLVWWQRWM